MPDEGSHLVQDRRYLEPGQHQGQDDADMVQASIHDGLGAAAPFPHASGKPDRVGRGYHLVSGAVK